MVTQKRPLTRRHSNDVNGTRAIIPAWYYLNQCSSNNDSGFNIPEACKRYSAREFLLDSVELPRLSRSGHSRFGEEFVIQRFYENFPDAVWAELKLWARNQATKTEIPAITECVAQVERVARTLTGVPNALRPDVVAFYAAETADMIARFRATTLATSDVAQPKQTP